MPFIASSALAQQPTLSPPTFDCGTNPSYGTSASGTVFALSAAVGQPHSATPHPGLTGTSAAGVTFTLIGGVSPGAAPPPPCAADFNGDGSTDPDDLGDFINCYFDTPPCERADFNGDTSIDPDDLGDFINAYFAGCP